MDGFSLTAHEGECLGIFGPSGCGKSTALRIMAGIERPDSGGMDFAGGITGISHSVPAAHEDLTPIELLRLYATLYGIPRGRRHSVAREILATAGLDDVRDRRIRSLPDGSKKVLEVATALICPGDLLLLDEPMTGLDRDTRHRLWEHLLHVRKHEGRTIIVATSRSEDAEMCDRIALMNGGRILTVGTLDRLRSMVGPEALVIKPLSGRPDPASDAGRWTIVGRSEDGSYVVEVGPDSRPKELIRQIPNAAAVRIEPRGLDSILEELLAEEDSQLELQMEG